MKVSGSSPRTRGTEFVLLSCLPHLRFIPADAGNRRTPLPGHPSPPVHPRGRGEQWRTVPPFRCGHGSSPRTRGTAAQQRVFWPSRPVHPRGRGEQSSWRTRNPRMSRFIPADAGNRPWWAPSGCRTKVHPRGRGEQQGDLRCAGIPAGSSPRTRGTAPVQDEDVHRHRFIPADAGNSARLAASILRLAVHPRGRGEQVRPSDCSFKLLRFIPADAGNSPVRTIDI